jgi:AcrR family transcriptional regulator
MKTSEAILAAAGELLEAGGTAAVTTRGVCTAAGVTAPTLYHHFGDMGHLINALVTKGIADFMAAKRSNRVSDDPVADLRRGWDLWIEFALRRPALFRLMVERASRDPELGQKAHAVMRVTLERMSQKGMLTRDVDFSARALQAASNGVVSLFGQGAKPAEVKETGALLFDSVLSRLIRKNE